MAGGFSEISCICSACNGFPLVSLVSNKDLCRLKVFIFLSFFYCPVEFYLPVSSLLLKIVKENTLLPAQQSCDLKADPHLAKVKILCPPKEGVVKYPVGY